MQNEKSLIDFSLFELARLLSCQENFDRYSFSSPSDKQKPFHIFPCQHCSPCESAWQYFFAQEGAILNQIQSFDLLTQLKRQCLDLQISLILLYCSRPCSDVTFPMFVAQISKNDKEDNDNKTEYERNEEGDAIDRWIQRIDFTLIMFDLWLSHPRQVFIADVVVCATGDVFGVKVGYRCPFHCINPFRSTGRQSYVLSGTRRFV